MKKTRLITICGSIQLVSAIAAIRTKEKTIGGDYKNILFIYSLNQDNEASTFRFRSTIEKMAKALIPIDKIIYFDETLTKITAIPSLSVLPRSIDEIWVNSNFHQEINILSNRYKNAKVIAYGDGPGIYFTKTCHYIFPVKKQKPSPQNIRSFLKKVIRNLNFISSRNSKFQRVVTILKNQLGINPEDKAPTWLPLVFNEGYFLFPKVFETPLPSLSYWEVPASIYAKVFEELKPLFDYSFLDTLIKVHQKKELSLCILLTANLSEAGRLMESAELAAYEETLHQLAEPSSLVLIKPHPRDKQEKLVRLKSKLESAFEKAILIDHPGTQYIPFEILVLHLVEHYFGSFSVFKERVKLITTSTACLTLAKLYGVKCQVGIPNSILKKYYYSDQLADRLKHNQLLRSAVERALKSGKFAYA